jgi:hypothetical protein
MPDVRISNTLACLAVTIAATAAARAATIDLVPIQDNTLYETAGNAPGGVAPPSNGAGSYLFTGRILIGDLRRALIAFDVAGSLPSGGVVTEVSLTLQMSKTIAGSTPVGLHRVLSDWGEGASDAGGEEGAGAPAQPGDATWIHTFYPSSLWLTPGGDFVGSASATQSVGDNGLYTWQSTPQLVTDVQSWLDSPSTNFGWMVIGSESSPPTAKRFNSRENGSGVPTLTITYQAPVPTAPVLGLLVLVAGLALAGAGLLRRRRAS